MEGAIWVFFVAMLLFGTSVLIHRLIEGRVEILRLPITWFYTSWLLGLALLSLPMFKYFEKFNSISAAYIISFLFIFSFGCIAASFWSRWLYVTRLKSRQSTSPVAAAPVSGRLIVSLLFMGIIGTSLLMINTLLGGSLSLTERLDSDNFAAVRMAHMISSESMIGPLYGPATLMSSIGGLGVAFVFYLRGSRLSLSAGDKWMYRIAILVLIFNIVIGFIGFGSRMFAVFAVFVAFVAFMEGRWAIGERLVAKRPSLKGFFIIFLSTAVTLTALWAAATVFLEKRVQKQDPQTLLFRTHRATLDPVVFGLTRSDLSLQYFMLSLSYVSTPIPTLTFYLDLPDYRQPGPFLGEYNFPAIARWLRRLTFNGDPYSWDRARYDIFKPLGDIGFGMNVWSTLVRDLIADFGKGGALLFLGFLGFFSQRIFDIQRNFPSVRTAGLLVYTRLILAFAGLISILFMPQVHWSLYLAIVLVIFGGTKKRHEVLARGRPVAEPLDVPSHSLPST